jgi:hypothetical protein
MVRMDKCSSIELGAFIREGEFRVYNNNTWESIPCILRAFIKAQEGLRIDRKPVSSLGDLIRVQALLNRKQTVENSRL